MVAGIKIAVAFENRNLAAFRPEKAKGMFLTESDSGRFLENLDLDPADVLGDPFVKDRAEKIAPSRCGNGQRIDERFPMACHGEPLVGGIQGGKAAGFSGARWRGLPPKVDAARAIKPGNDTGQESEKGPPDFLEKTKDVFGKAGISGPDDAEDIGRNTASAKDFVSPYRQVERRPAAGGPSVPVVKVPGSVQAQTDRESLPGEETAPFIVQKNTIGLHPVGDSSAGGSVFFLKRDSPLKKGDPGQSRLPSMPGKSDDLIR